MDFPRLIPVLSIWIGLHPVWGREEPQPTVVPVGVMNLFTQAKPVVGYRYDEGRPVTLGYAWTGFDELSGVYFVPEETTTGAQVFMHCPWRPGPGVAFADYRLKLPPAKKIRLEFEVGVRPTARRTDGVTYRIRVGGRTLFDHHCTWKEFRSFVVPLSEFSGQTVTCRLEVDPGPARNTRDDWSLWRNVRILAGTEAEIRAAQARAAAARVRRRAADVKRGERAAKADLLPLATAHTDSVRPGVLHPTTVSVQRVGDRFVFRCRGGETIEYRLDPRTASLAGITVRVEGRQLDSPPFAGGPRIHLDGREFGRPTSQLRVALQDARLEGHTVTCRYRFTNPKTGSSASLVETWRAQGKSLCLEVRGEPDRFSGFIARPADGRQVPTAFAVGGSPVWRREGVYVATVTDLMFSEASGVGNSGVTYTPLTNGRRNALHDRFYLTVTGRYEEALADVPHPPSPFLADLAHRVVLDVWGGAFADDERWLNEMAAWGLDSFFIIKHVWQRDGYDHTYPNTMPANEGQGGDAALRSCSRTAQRLGSRFCVHENFYDYYPNAEAFRREDCALGANGKTIPGWDNGTVRALLLKPSKLLDYARRFSPEVKQRYDCNAAYHDIMPTWHVDFDARVPDSGKIRVTHEYTRALCDFDRKLFGGPVVFEAATAAMAGVYDGGCNHGVDTYRTPPSVAYELLKVHPKMSNHGFGYYERWLPWGYGPGWSTYVMTDRELDKYRAYEIAFGRTGFIGHQLMKHRHGVAREYYLMQAFGRAYTGRRVTGLQYRMDDTWVDAGTAARYGEFTAVHTTYEGGQHVYVNLGKKPVRVAGHLLPSFGALTFGPRAEAWTALRNGQVCDFARYGDLTYADARSHVWQPPQSRPAVKPSVAALNYVGHGEFELTVNWQVGRTPARNYTVFWHFRHNGKIAFQLDHRPNTPTTHWPVGHRVADGPRRVKIPADPEVRVYDIVAGLYDEKGRAPLIGETNELLLGRLRVKRNGAEAVDATLDPTVPSTPGIDPAAYLEAANTEHKVIDFGPVATDGAVLLRRRATHRVVIPIPPGEPMTLGLSGKGLLVRAFGAGRRPLPPPTCSTRKGKTWFRTRRGATRYEAGP